MSTTTDPGVEMAQYTLNTVVTELEGLAARLRRLSPSLEGTDRTSPTDAASEIVSTYIQGVGNIGGRLGDIVRNAGRVAEARVDDVLNGMP